MEENNNENKQSNFKAVPNPANGKIKPKKEKKSNAGFGKTVVLPFFSGVVGCAAVMGTVLGVPEIKNQLFPSTPSTISVAPSSSTSSDGTVTQISLKKYSDTSELSKKI